MGQIRPLFLLQTPDQNLNAVQDNIHVFTTQLEVNPLLDGALVEDQVLAIGNNIINHTLDRELQGWVVTDVNAATDIYKTSSNDKQIVLNSSAIATIDLWVF
jgi:hypothetical protein